MAAAGAIGAIGGAVAQPIAAHFAQKRAFKYTKKMMKNKWQWEVADLIAAGLNPILGYTKGGPGIGGSPIPSISGSMGTTALSAMKLRSELKLLEASADKMAAEATRARSTANLQAQQSKKVSLEVSEFPIKPMGVARRLFSPGSREGVRKFLQSVGDVPDWIRARLQNSAER